MQHSQDVKLCSINAEMQWQHFQHAKMPAGEQTTPEPLSRGALCRGNQVRHTHLVLLSEVCKKEEVGRLGTLELSRISGTLLSPWGFWMILLILCHDHTVIRLQEQLESPKPLASPCHMIQVSTSPHSTDTVSLSANKCKKMPYV